MSLLLYFLLLLLLLCSWMDHKNPFFIRFARIVIEQAACLSCAVVWWLAGVVVWPLNGNVKQ